MERVAFLVEATSERIGCLLNPESVVVRRLSGVRPRRSLGGQLAGKRLADDPLLYTGGGTTQLDLDLLFDVSLGGSTVTAVDVRELTGALWRLSENSSSDQADWQRPPLVRLVWGKAWNFPGVVTSVAERLEYFTAEGAPRRSWLRLRLLRIVEPGSEESPFSQQPQTLPMQTEDVGDWPSPGRAGEGAPNYPDDDLYLRGISPLRDSNEGGQTAWA